MHKESTVGSVEKLDVDRGSEEREIKLMSNLKNVELSPWMSSED